MRPQYSSKQPASEQESIPAMVKFTDKCEQPFVVLFTPPNRGWDYRTAASNLKGQGELQSHLTFFEFVKSGVVYFGAQADSEQNAQTLMTAYKERVPKAKPMLGCLNATGYLPNAQTNKWDARVVGINLTVGVEL
jgi:hypothetical protein